MRRSTTAGRSLIAGMLVAVAVAACGSQNTTSHWQANFTGGTSLYMSIATSGGNVSGWAKYGDGSFQHYDGTVNSDGTLSVSAYTGDTLTINGNSMTATASDGSGTTHWAQISESAYKSAGGPAG